MAPQSDALAPAGSSTYSSNTMYVGDGTWDSSRNDFLLPNLQGLNFATMLYNGMGNRFVALDEYHYLIQGHGVLATITFLFVLPASIMLARFQTRPVGSGVMLHMYLNILAIFLVTIVFILGWFAVGPSRSLTNPHHGIGLTIYVLMLVQVIGGTWVRRRLRKTNPRRPPIKLMLHQWLGRAIALLGIAQVPLGLTLYGSPQFTFVLYTLWMTFLLVLYFVLSYRAAEDYDVTRLGTVIEGSVIEERKSGGIGRYILPAAAAAGLAGIFARRRSKRESRESRQEVIPSRRGSRRGSGSFIDEEKYEDRRERRGGLTDKLLAGAAIVGAGALFKGFLDRRNRRREDDAYSAVATDTPSRLRRPRRDDHSIGSGESIDVRRTERDRRHGPILPGPGNPLDAATAISAASRPVTPRHPPPPAIAPITPMTPIGRLGGRSRRESFSSDDSRATPRRDDREDHTVRNTVLGTIGLGWMAKRFKDRRDRQEQERLDAVRAREREDEMRFEEDRRQGRVPRRFTGDGTPRRNTRITEISNSDITSHLTASTVEPRRGNMPPLAADAIPVAAGGAGAAIGQSRSRHDIIEPVPLPPVEPRQWQESGSEVYNSAGGREHRRHHESGRGADAAIASAALGAAAAEDRRRREQSRGPSVGPPVEPVSVKVQVHGDRGVTLRRLTEEEAAADRRARRNESRRRGDSASSMSGAETAASNRRYRRDASARRDAEIAAERYAEAGPSSRPLSPPRPAFAGGKTPKDSSYFSGPPPAPPPAPESLGSPESHGTWSGMRSPSAAGTAAEDPAERRRRRRLERNQRQAAGVTDYD